MPEVPKEQTVDEMLNEAVAEIPSDEAKPTPVAETPAEEIPGEAPAEAVEEPPKAEEPVPVAANPAAPTPVVVEPETHLPPIQPGRFAPSADLAKLITTNRAELAALSAKAKTAEYDPIADGRERDRIILEAQQLRDSIDQEKEVFEDYERQRVHAREFWLDFARQNPHIGIAKGQKLYQDIKARVKAEETGASDDMIAAMAKREWMGEVKRMPKGAPVKQNTPPKPVAGKTGFAPAAVARKKPVPVDPLDEFVQAVGEDVKSLYV